MSPPQVVSVDPAAEGDAPTCLAPVPPVDADDWPTETMLPEIEVDFEDLDSEGTVAPPSQPGEPESSRGAAVTAPTAPRAPLNSWLAIVPPFDPELAGRVAEGSAEPACPPSDASLDELAWEPPAFGAEDGGTAELASDGPPPSWGVRVADELLSELPPPPASGIRLSDDYSSQALVPPAAAALPTDGACPPSLALSLADELLAEGYSGAADGRHEVAEDLSVLDDDDWAPPPTDSVAALLVDAIAAYEEEHDVTIDYLDEVEPEERPTTRFHRDELWPSLEHLEGVPRRRVVLSDGSPTGLDDEEGELCDEETGRYEDDAELWLEGLGGCPGEAVGRITIIPERTDEETCRMERRP